MLLGYNVVADREPKPGAFASRLGSEKGLEQFLSDLRRNARAVVAHTNFDPGTDIARSHFKARPKVPLVTGRAALVGRIESIPEQVEEHTRHVLRHELNGYDAAIEIAL